MPASLQASEKKLSADFPFLAAPSEVLLVARWPVGGIRTHMGYNYPALRAADHRCTLVVPADLAGEELSQVLPDAEIVGVAKQGRSCPLWSSVRSLVRSHRFRLVHAHGLTAAAHASAACLDQRVPVVVTIHEPLRKEQFRGVRGSLKRWLLARALGRAAALITVSEDGRDNLLSFFPNLRRRVERIHAIPNGIDTSRCGATARVPALPLRTRLKLDDEVTLIGFLGRFMPEKGFPQLIEAVARLGEFGGVRPFHVVAFGSSDYRTSYEREIARRGLARFISLHDFVPNVAPVLRQLELVVVPSLWEASSLVSMEAMSAGVPVLGSDCPGLREVLRGTPSRMVRTGEVAALEVGLRHALAQPWREEAQAYAPVARERFDVRRSADRLVELYANVSAFGSTRSAYNP